MTHRASLWDTIRLLHLPPPADFSDQSDMGQSRRISNNDYCSQRWHYRHIDCLPERIACGACTEWLRRMLIDCHTHVSPSRGDDLLRELNRVAVTHAIVMIIPSAMTITEEGDYALEINDMTLERMREDNRRLGTWARDVAPNPLPRVMNSSFHDRRQSVDEQTENNRRDLPRRAALLPFAWLDYRIKQAASFFEQLVARYHFKGLKIHQAFNGPADDRYFDLVDKAVALDIPIMIHTGFRESAPAKNIGILASQFPRGKFICAHLLEESGLNAKSDYFRLANDHGNVYLECSYVRHPRRLREFVRAVGADRILFGSDFPFGAGDIAWDLTKVRWAGIDDDAKEKILWKNAAALFEL